MTDSHMSHARTHAPILNARPCLLCSRVDEAPAARSPTRELESASMPHEKAEPDDFPPPCMHSAASLIFEAMYGEPPRSG